MDLRNGHSQYLSTIKQLVDALPKTQDPASCFCPPGAHRPPRPKSLRHSMRAAIWFLLPSDGTFRRSSTSLQYFLTRQGQRVVLRRGWCDPTSVGEVSKLGPRHRSPSLKRSRPEGHSPSSQRSRQEGSPFSFQRSWQGESPAPQAPKKNKAPQMAREASYSRFQPDWKPAWN